MLALVAVGCGSTPLPVSPPSVPCPPLVLHADVAFLPAERRAIERAAASLEEQTGGGVRVVVRFDRYFGEMASRDLLLRATSDAPWVRALDAVAGGRALGYTDQESRRVYLVADRLVSEQAWVAVAIHEFAHAVGAGHVGGSGSVLASASSGSATLSADDAVEIERACATRREDGGPQ